MGDETPRIDQGVTAVSPASSGSPKVAASLLPRIRLPWPEGTAFFAFRTWVALAIGLYAAFFFQLEGASSAGVCILILAQPAQGMVLSKSIYRIAGTLAGVTSAIVLTALFPQDRAMLLAAFAVWMGVLTAIGTLLRDFRAYGCILAGYTVAIISIANIDAPLSTFSSAVNRVAAILIGVVAIGLTNAVLATTESSQSLVSKLRAATTTVVTMARDALETRTPPDSSACIRMSATLMPLRSEISFAAPEKADGRARAKGARSALLGLFEMITATQAVGAGLNHVDPSSPIIEDVVAIGRRALTIQRPERCLPALDALAVPAIDNGTLSIEEAFLLDRMRFMIEVMSDVRNGLRSVRSGRPPRRDVSLPVHQDYFAVVLNATRVLVAIGIAEVLSVWSGIADTAQALVFTAVFVSLGSIQPDPRGMAKAALLGMPAVIVAGAIYAFFVFPNIDGYPLFILSLAPLVFVMCWLIKIGQPGMGLIFGVQTLVLISPANVQTLDPTAFVDIATMLAVAGVAICLSILLIIPVQPAQRRLRLALAVGTTLRKALADERRLPQPRASLHYDRLSQFKTWQRDETVTLARRRTAKRLSDIGNLAYAVRRSWRGLDAARPYIDPAVDARARKVLPSLTPDETLDLAHTYLASAKSQEKDAALSLVHAAAALYGTALVTSDEERLLKHVELLRRKI
jgi:uncharacterized membrane protein YccC